MPYLTEEEWMTAILREIGPEGYSVQYVPAEDESVDPELKVFYKGEDISYSYQLGYSYQSISLNRYGYEDPSNPGTFFSENIHDGTPDPAELKTFAQKLFEHHLKRRMQ